MNEFEKNGFATFIDNGDGWERIPNAKFMMRDENGTEIEMTPNEVIKQLMQDNKSLEHYINNLQSKIDKTIEFVESMEYCGQEDYFYDNKSEDPCGNNTYNDSKNKLLSILKEDK